MDFLENIVLYAILLVCILLNVLLVIYERVTQSGLFGDKFEVAEEVFNGGRFWFTKNFIITAFAVSCSFSPSLTVEVLYLSDSKILGLLITRTVAFAGCVALWHKIAELGTSSMNSFLTIRFNSKFAVALYHINAIGCLIYFRLMYNGPMLFSLNEVYKLHLDGFIINIVFMLLCSFGGMRVSLPLCTILSVVEILAGLIFLGKTRGTKFVMVWERTDHCLSQWALHNFGSVFPLMLTAQPLYRLYYHVGSFRKAIAAMVLGYCIFLVKFGINYFASRRLQQIGRPLSLPARHAFRLIFPSNYQPQEYMEVGIHYGYLGNFVLGGMVYGPMATFYSLRLCQLMTGLYEKMVPLLEKSSVQLTGVEMNNIHAATYCTIASFLFVTMLNADRYIIMPHFYHLSLYVPNLCTCLSTTVTLMIFLGAVTSSVRFLHIISAFAITALLIGFPLYTVFWSTKLFNSLDAIATWERRTEHPWDCVALWANFGTLCINILLAIAIMLLARGQKVRMGTLKLANRTTFGKMYERRWKNKSRVSKKKKEESEPPSTEKEPAGRSGDVEKSQKLESTPVNATKSSDYVSRSLENPQMTEEPQLRQRETEKRYSSVMESELAGSSAQRNATYSMSGKRTSTTTTTASLTLERTETKSARQSVVSSNRVSSIKITLPDYERRQAKCDETESTTILATRENQESWMPSEANDRTSSKYSRKSVVLNSGQYKGHIFQIEPFPEKSNK